MSKEEHRRSFPRDTAAAGGLNKVYAEFFPGPMRPSRSAIGIEFPDSKTKVEIEMIAWAP